MHALASRLQRRIALLSMRSRPLAAARQRSLACSLLRHQRLRLGKRVLGMIT
jgi:hypothetical protein